MDSEHEPRGTFVPPATCQNIRSQGVERPESRTASAPNLSAPATDKAPPSDGFEAPPGVWPFSAMGVSFG